MKTTVEVSDALLTEARKVAAREGTTLRRLIEAGLRLALDEHLHPHDFHLRGAAINGRGLRREFAGGSWDRIREATYEQRGG